MVEPTPHGNIPLPDPTVLTTEALHREIGILKETIEGQIKAIKDSIAAETKANADLVREQFQGIQTQFDLIEKAADKLATADKTALAAALQAQKEAAAQTYANIVAVIEKSEGGFTKQIDAIAEIIASSTKGLEDKITAMTSRLDRGDGRVSGAGDQKTEGRASLGTLIAVVTVGIAVLAIIVTVVIANIATK